MARTRERALRLVAHPRRVLGLELRRAGAEATFCTTALRMASTKVGGSSPVRETNNGAWFLVGDPWPTHRVTLLQETTCTASPFPTTTVKQPSPEAPKYSSTRVPSPTLWASRARQVGPLYHRPASNEKCQRSLTTVITGTRS